MFSKKFILTFLIFLQFTFPSKCQSQNNEAVILKLDGSIKESTYEKVANFLESGGNIIQIRSGGGDVRAALKTADLIRKKNVTIIVDQFCFSSCANYLFLASTHKIVRQGAIVGFHGWVAPVREKSGENDEPIAQGLIELHNEELRFFESIDFNPALLRKSYEITASGHDVIEVTINGKRRTTKDFELYEHKKIKSYILKMMENQSNKEWEIARVNRGLRSSVYFPNQTTLISHGATGLISYPYPDSQYTLNQIAKQISPDLRAYGDF